MKKRIVITGSTERLDNDSLVFLYSKYHINLVPKWQVFFVAERSKIKQCHADKVYNNMNIRERSIEGFKVFLEYLIFIFKS